MIKKIKILQDVEIKDSIVCDMCGKEYKINTPGMGNWDFIHAQEFIHIHHEGGYGSIFGDYFARDLDGLIDIDICQNCFKEHIVEKINKYDIKK